MGHPAQEACVSTNGWLMSPTSQDLPLSISESQFTGLRRLPPPLRTRCGCRYPEGRLWALSHLFQGPPVFASPPPAALLFEPTAEQWTLQSAQQPAQGGHPPCTYLGGDSTVTACVRAQGCARPVSPSSAIPRLGLHPLPSSRLAARGFLPSRGASLAPALLAQSGLQACACGNPDRRAHPRSHKSGER